MNSTDDFAMSFPTGFEFLKEHERLAERSAADTEQFLRGSGEKLPPSARRFGTVVSLLYRAACCFWGCRGGDHQVEWLSGRVVNQAMGSYRLIQSSHYDEALVLVRGIGEVANLLHLFNADPRALGSWKQASRRQRFANFGPAAVRKRLEESTGTAPVEQDRYQRLCEIGTHPVPGTAPGHFTGTGTPILGLVSQPVGIYVCVNELCFASALSAVGAARLLGLEKLREKQIIDESAMLIRSLGAFTILNYEQLLAEALSPSDENTEDDVG